MVWRAAGSGSNMGPRRPRRTRLKVVAKTRVHVNVIAQESCRAPTTVKLSRKRLTFIRARLSHVRVIRDGGSHHCVFRRCFCPYARPSRNVSQPQAKRQWKTTLGLVRLTMTSSSETLTRNDDAEVLLVSTLQQLDKMLDEMRLGNTLAGFSSVARKSRQL